ncbi:MAG: hypothetical protein ACRCZ0_08325 [Cetobacterium sp.]
MKYYLLKINGKIVRKSEIVQYDAGVDMYCTFTDDVNLAEKFTSEEVENTLEWGVVHYIKQYLNDFDWINDLKNLEAIESYEFVEICL